MQKQLLFIESHTTHMGNIKSANTWYIQRSAPCHAVDEAYSIRHAASIQDNHVSQDGIHSAQIGPGIPHCFGAKTVL
jgi:hypothetical protein